MLRRWMLLSLMCFSTSRTTHGGDVADVDVPWPVTRAGAKAIIRTTISLDDELGGTPDGVHLSARLVSDHAQEIIEGSVPSTWDVRLTHGRVSGEWKTTMAGRTQVTPVFQDAFELNDNLRPLFGVGKPGSRVQHALAGRSAPDATANALPESRARLSTFIEVALPISAPSATVHVGTTWAAPLPIVTPTFTSYAIAVRHTIAAVTADVITVRSDASTDTESPAPEPHAWHVELHVTRRISRADGLLAGGTYDSQWTGIGSPSAVGTWASKFERAAPSIRPDGDAEVERAIDALANGNATVRRSAALTLAPIWPGGARAVPLLAAALDDDDDAVREAAAAALERLGMKAIDAVLPFVRGLGPDDTSGFGAMVSVVLALGFAVTPTDLSAGVSGGPLGGSLLGARRRDIMSQFLVEAATLSTVGAMIGIILGILLAQLIAAVSPLPATVAPWSIAAGVVVGAGVGIISGIYPASRASRLDPIAALRAE